MGRFINADNYPTTGQGLTGNNMFAYCGNNPVSRADDCGEFWHIIVGAVVGAVVNGALKVIENITDNDPSTDWNDGLVLSVATGAVTGAFAVTGCGPGVQMAVNAAATAVEELPSVVHDIKNGADVLSTLGGYALEVGIGAITSNSAGYGSKAATNLGKQTVKRTVNAFKHTGILAGFSEMGKAAKWYLKSGGKTIINNTCNQLISSLNDYADSKIRSLFT